MPVPAAAGPGSGATRTSGGRGELGAAGRRSSALPLPVTVSDRAERVAGVAEIARRIAEGCYRVPVEQVAEAVLAFHRREA